MNNIPRAEFHPQKSSQSVTVFSGQFYYRFNQLISFECLLFSALL